MQNVMLTDSVRAQGWTNFTFERLLNSNDLSQVWFFILIQLECLNLLKIDSFLKNNNRMLKSLPIICCCNMHSIRLMDSQVCFNSKTIQLFFHNFSKLLGGDVHDSFGSLLVNFKKTGPIITQQPTTQVYTRKEKRYFLWKLNWNSRCFVDDSCSTTYFTAKCHSWVTRIT